MNEWMNELYGKQTNSELPREYPLCLSFATLKWCGSNMQLNSTSHSPWITRSWWKWLVPWSHSHSWLWDESGHHYRFLGSWSHKCPVQASLLSIRCRPASHGIALAVLPSGHYQSPHGALSEFCSVSIPDPTQISWLDHVLQRELMHSYSVRNLISYTHSHSYSYSHRHIHTPHHTTPHHTTPHKSWHCYHGHAKYMLQNNRKEKCRVTALTTTNVHSQSLSFSIQPSDQRL